MFTKERSITQVKERSITQVKLFEVNYFNAFKLLCNECVNTAEKKNTV